MSLANEYERQARWRDWSRAIAALPPLQGRTVLDLGCGIGDQAARLAAAGARVIGLDANEDLLLAARDRGLADAEFRLADLRQPLDERLAADGIWSSFVAAYFPDLGPALARWSAPLRPRGWIALTEIDDLFGHEPLAAHARAALDAYAEHSLTTARYDFRMGRKLAATLERARFQVVTRLTLDDAEFSFRGPAPAGVLDGWRARFGRMTGLRDFCGAEFPRVRDEFLACLAREDHCSTSQVVFCLAARPAPER